MITIKDRLDFIRNHAKQIELAAEAMHGFAREDYEQKFDIMDSQLDQIRCMVKSIILSLESLDNVKRIEDIDKKIIKDVREVSVDEVINEIISDLTPIRWPMITESGCVDYFIDYQSDEFRELMYDNKFFEICHKKDYASIPDFIKEHVDGPLHESPLFKIKKENEDE